MHGVYLQFNHKMWDLSDTLDANKMRKNQSIVSKNAVYEKAVTFKKEVVDWDWVF